MVKIERCTKIREEGKRMLCMRHTQANDIRGLWQYSWVYWASVWATCVRGMAMRTKLFC